MATQGLSLAEYAGIVGSTMQQHAIGMSVAWYLLFPVGALVPLAFRGAGDDLTWLFGYVPIMLGGMSLTAFGTFAAIDFKTQNGDAHLNSVHSIAGLFAIALAVLVMIIGMVPRMVIGDNLYRTAMVWFGRTALFLGAVAGVLGVAALQDLFGKNDILVYIQVVMIGSILIYFTAVGGYSYCHRMEHTVDADFTLGAAVATPTLGSSPMKRAVTQMEDFELGGLMDRSGGASSSGARGQAPSNVASSAYGTQRSNPRYASSQVGSNPYASSQEQSIQSMSDQSSMSYGRGGGGGGGRTLTRNVSPNPMPGYRGMSKPVPATPSANARQSPPPVPPRRNVTPYNPRDTERVLSSSASTVTELRQATLGSRLYQIVREAQPQMATKITGMLLELDIEEVEFLLKNREELAAKIQSAVEDLEELAKS